VKQTKHINTYFSWYIPFVIV